MSPSHASLHDMLQIIGAVYQDRMPFNRLLGIKVEVVDPGSFQVRVDMREELIGNFVKNILHGGVISSILDLTGGLIASADILRRMEGASVEEITERMAGVGTIDLRVDYLRTGKGRWFVASGTPLRTGKHVAVVRTEFHDDDGLLIALGTGTYFVGA